MNKQRILRRVVGIVLFLVLMTTSAFADYTISWQSGGGSPIISSSSATVKCDGKLEVSKYLLNTGESVLSLIHILRDYFLSQNPKSVKICTLLDKPSRRTADVKADYIGFTVDDLFRCV